MKTKFVNSVASMLEEKQVASPTLTLVVEYSDFDIETFEGIRELIASARGYGRPISAKLLGAPGNWDIKV